MTDLDQRILESEMIRLQRSTGTRFLVFLRLHNWLRMHNKWYYWWHFSKVANPIHVLALLAYLVLTPFVIHAYLTRSELASVTHPIQLNKPLAWKSYVIQLQAVAAQSPSLPD
jgi:hypothetical protein